MKGKCFICDTELDLEDKVPQKKREKKQYSHKEHIIPNAIGGRLTSDKILCAGCGGSFGENIDNALIIHCQNFSTLLNVSRDRGKNQDIISEKNSGEKIIISASGEIKPKIEGKVEIPLKKDGKPERIIARSKQELNMIKGVLKKEHPDYSYKITPSETYEKETLNIPYLISEDTLRGVCKIAVEYYLEKGGLQKYISHLISYLQKDSNQKCVHVFHPKYDLKVNDGFYHLIHLRGIKEYKILFAYIELFGASSFFVALNWGDYYGESFEENYLYDLKNSIQLDLDTLNFDYCEANTFFGEVQEDWKAGKTYLIREDMNDRFMNKVRKFEKKIELERDDIRFVPPTIDK